ncbi:MAG: hypothetical protein EA001_04505 [Oscillatoriales cyanobacterium]|nr:MAG: hypothetical protein EA001_04505 [Oscillatoriales cyanobacterium]
MRGSKLSTIDLRHRINVMCVVMRVVMQVVVAIEIVLEIVLGIVLMIGIDRRDRGSGSLRACGERRPAIGGWVIG